MSPKETDAQKLDLLEGKFAEIKQSREEIIGEISHMNDVITSGVEAVSGKQAGGLAKTLKSVSSFFQNSVNMMLAISKQVKELTQLLATIKVQMDDIQRRFQ